MADSDDLLHGVMSVTVVALAVACCAIAAAMAFL